jgi:hypothetical protein
MHLPVVVVVFFGFHSAHTRVTTPRCSEPLTKLSSSREGKTNKQDENSTFRSLQFVPSFVVVSSMSSLFVFSFNPSSGGSPFSEHFHVRLLRHFLHVTVLHLFPCFAIVAAGM